MKRSGFKPAWTPRPAKQIDYTPTSRPVVKVPAVERAFNPQPKSEPIRDESYLRLVASLPCAHCGWVGATQAAHADEGKGMGIKSSDDTAFPLCGPHWSPASRRMISGCHAEIGSEGRYSREDRRELERRYGRETRIKLGRYVREEDRKNA